MTTSQSREPSDAAIEALARLLLSLPDDWPPPKGKPDAEGKSTTGKGSARSKHGATA